VSGDVNSVELYVNDALVDVIDSAPWTFVFDPTDYGFELLRLEFRAMGSAAHASDQLTLLVDGTVPTPALSEGFESEPFAVLRLDARGYAPTLLSALKQIDPASWTPEDVAANGPTTWGLSSSGHGSSGAMRFGDDEQGYGAYETDVLITRGIDLGYLVEGDLAYFTKHNIQEGGPAGDRGCVLYTSDRGRSFTPLTVTGSPVTHSGYASEYYAETIDLADLIGQEVHFIFLFESDASGAGEEPTEPAGWWLDDIVLSGTRVGIGGLSISYVAAPGSISGVESFAAAPASPVFADSIEYWLDFFPLDEVDDYDTILTVSQSPFEAQFDLSARLELPNHSALLHALPALDDLTQGTPAVVPVYIFNRLGDVNADGRVDAADAAAYDGMLGLASADPAYIPFFDSDLDGIITEADAGVIGYYFSD
jgi:hypothetical protein